MISKNSIETVVKCMRYFISCGTQGYLRIHLSEILGQGILHVIENSFLTLLKIIKAINPKQDKMLLVDSIETVFYVTIPTSV